MVPTDAISFLDKVTTRAEALLQGEPARAIGYGAALVVIGVIAVSNALGYTRFGDNIDLPTALVVVTAAIATVSGIIESIRKFVFSPKTVAQIVADASQGNG